LAERHRVFVFDLLGFGDSERHVDQDVSVSVHGRVLGELMTIWGLRRPAVVGHDIGGAAVLRAHLIEGVPFARIALLDAVVLRPWITPRTRRMQREIESYRSLPDADLAASVREHLESATAHPLDRDVFTELFGQWDGPLGQALYLRNLTALDEADTQAFEPLLPSMSVPVLVLWGADDAWLPVSVSERVDSLIPNARRVIVPDAGHFIMEDQPQVIAEQLLAFLTDDDA
jgi:pimeloyl-ACP methyl ester carboxylesterase